MSINEKELYSIQGVDSIRGLSSWVREINEKYRCKECRFYRDDFPRKVRNFYIEKEKGELALTSAYGFDIYIARKDFIGIFAKEAQDILVYGKVYDKNKNLMEDYITYSSDFRVILRGSEISDRLKDCPACGRLGYSLLFPCYVLRGSLTESSLHVTWKPNGILITEELYKRIDRKKHKGLYIRKVPVLDEPVERDNFAGIPLRV